MGKFKRLGCCTVCDVPIFEVTSRHMEGPLQGEPKSLGMPIDGSRRFYIVRASGRQSFWSVCANCEITPSNIAELNKKEIASMVREKSLALGDDARQRDYRERMLRLFQFDVPLGVLGMIPWAEVR